MPKTARVTGFSPYNKNQIDNSKFVILRSKEEDDEYIKKRKERSRLDINGTIINTSSFIDKIIDRLVVHPKFNHLCYLPTRGITWTSIISKYCCPSLPNDCYFLGKLPQCVSSANTIITQD